MVTMRNRKNANDPADVATEVRRYIDTLSGSEMFFPSPPFLERPSL